MEEMQKTIAQLTDENTRLKQELCELKRMQIGRAHV